MEEVYPREDAARRRGRRPRAQGGGRTVYIPWNIGGIFWEVLAADHERLIANAVRWALGKRPRVEVSGTARARLAVRENDDGVAVVLNNLTNPMMMKGPIREIFPVGQQHGLGRGARRARRSAAPGCSSPAARPRSSVDGRPRRDRGAGHRHARGRAPHLGGRTPS